MVPVFTNYPSHIYFSRKKIIPTFCVLVKPCHQVSKQRCIAFLIPCMSLYFHFSGYDRDLPGFPRYRVLGTDSSGVFNLQISNATLKDDARYECQVGPSRNERPIRAWAQLSVMCKFGFFVNFLAM